jgi:AraC-like DNA-binding protein
MFGAVQRAAIDAGTMSALNIVPVLDALERLGIDSARVLALAGATVEEIRAPNARVPAALEFSFWDAMVEHTRDPLIGLRVADEIQVGALGAYEYLLRNSQTLRSGIDQAIKFERVMDDLTRVRIVDSEHADEAVLRHYREGGLPHVGVASECLFSCLVRLGKQAFPSERDRVRRIRFAHVTSADPSVYQAHFGCPVSFGAPFNELVFRKALLDEPFVHADPALSRVLEEHMNHVLERLPSEDPFVQRARTLIGDALQRQGDVSLEQLARSLHLSERTLRRRLEEHGTSYKNLLDELRHELACHYVTRTSDSFEATGARLGFADVSAFYRAFKRWTGATPAAYRARANRQGS